VDDCSEKIGGGPKKRRMECGAWGEGRVRQVRGWVSVVKGQEGRGRRKEEEGGMGDRIGGGKSVRVSNGAMRRWRREYKSEGGWGVVEWRVKGWGEWRK